jgi:hypothetical protein
MELNAANICVQINAPDCACLDPTTFLSSYPSVIEISTFSEMAFTFPEDPEFCNLMNKRVCEDVKLSYDCCCQEETLIYRECEIAHITTNRIPVPVPCEHTCSSGETETKSGGSGGLVAGILITLLIIAAGVGYYFYRKRRIAQEVENEEDETDSAEKPLQEERKGIGSKMGSMFQGLFSKSTRSENSGNVSKTSKNEATEELRDVEYGSGSSSGSSSYSSSINSGSESDHRKSHRERPLPVSSAAKPVVRADRARDGPPNHPINGTARQEQPERKKHSPPSKKSTVDSYSDDSSSSSSLSSCTKKTAVDRVVVEISPSFHSKEVAVPPPNNNTKKDTSTRAEQRDNKKSIEKLRASLHSRDSGRSSFVDLAKEKQVAKEKMEELDDTESQLNKHMKSLHERVETMSLATSRGKPTAKTAEMDKLLKERSETFLRLREVETQRGLYKDRLKTAEAEAQKLRNERVETTKRISELEAQNAALKRKAKEPSVDSKERSAPHKTKSNQQLRMRSEHDIRPSSIDLKERSAQNKTKSNHQLMRSEHGTRSSSRRQDMKKTQSERRVYTSSKVEELCTSLDHQQIKAWSKWKSKMNQTKI